MSTGNEWADEGWTSSGGGDRWKLSENVDGLVRLRMKEQRTLPSPRGDWEAVITDVDAVHKDGKGYDTHSDVALGNAWVLATFSDHLPYTAVGVVESFKTDKGTGYRLRKATDKERKTLDNAVQDPGF